MKIEYYHRRYDVDVDQQHLSERGPNGGLLSLRPTYEESEFDDIDQILGSLNTQEQLQEETGLVGRQEHLSHTANGEMEQNSNGVEKENADAIEVHNAEDECNCHCHQEGRDENICAELENILGTDLISIPTLEEIENIDNTQEVEAGSSSNFLKQFFKLHVSKRRHKPLYIPSPIECNTSMIIEDETNECNSDKIVNKPSEEESNKENEGPPVEELDQSPLARRRILPLQPQRRRTSLLRRPSSITTRSSQMSSNHSEIESVTRKCQCANCLKRAADLNSSRGSAWKVVANRCSLQAALVSTGSDAVLPLNIRPLNADLTNCKVDSESTIHSGSTSSVVKGCLKEEDQETTPSKTVRFSPYSTSISDGEVQGMPTEEQRDEKYYSRKANKKIQEEEKSPYPINGLLEDFKFGFGRKTEKPQVAGGDPFEIKIIKPEDVETSDWDTFDPFYDDNAYFFGSQKENEEKEFAEASDSSVIKKSLGDGEIYNAFASEFSKVDALSGFLSNNQDSMQRLPKSKNEDKEMDSLKNSIRNLSNASSDIQSKSIGTRTEINSDSDLKLTKIPFMKQNRGQNGLNTTRLGDGLKFSPSNKANATASLRVEDVSQSSYLI